MFAFKSSVRRLTKPRRLQPISRIFANKNPTGERALTQAVSILIKGLLGWSKGVPNTRTHSKSHPIQLTRLRHPMKTPITTLPRTNFFWRIRTFGKSILATLCGQIFLIPHPSPGQIFLLNWSILRKYFCDQFLDTPPPQN